MDDYNSSELRFIGFDSNGNITNIFYFNRPTGRMRCNGYDQNSDIRKKNIIEDFNIDISDISNAPSFKFKWKNSEDDKLHIGTSAQYWKEILPEIITESLDDEKTLSVQYDVAALISVISLAKKIVEQDKEIEKLKSDIEKLK